MASFTVENYIKAIYSLSRKSSGDVSTNAIAEKLGTKPATVSDMLRKLKDAGLVRYKKYQGTTLTKKGNDLAIQIIRKHRLWETFLVEKLEFKWDEVHDMAEELEHIDSNELVNRLEAFLGHPKFDPHGDPIPDRNGDIHRRDQIALTELEPGEKGIVTGVRDSSKEFLQFLDQINIELGQTISVSEIIEFDGTRNVLSANKPMSLSIQVSKNLFVKKMEE